MVVYCVLPKWIRCANSVYVSIVQLYQKTNDKQKDDQGNLVACFKFRIIGLSLYWWGELCARCTCANRYHYYHLMPLISMNLLFPYLLCMHSIKKWRNEHAFVQMYACTRVKRGRGLSILMASFNCIGKIPINMGYNDNGLWIHLVIVMYWNLSKKFSVYEHLSPFIAIRC